MFDLLSQATSQFASISIQHFLILTISGLAAVTAALIAASRIRNISISISDTLSIFCLIIYLNIILQLTLFGRNDGSRVGMKLVPFQNIFDNSGHLRSLIAMYAFLNVLLFVPYGFVLSWLPVFRRQKTWLNVLLAVLISFATSLLIETAQLITERGYYETEDLLCNTFGGLIGSLLFIAVLRVMSRLAKCSRNTD